MESFDELIAIMARLRAPGGCPWDREQTHRSIRKYVIEEAYEVAEAIDRDDPAELCAELGDLLLQVVFHSEMAREAGRFSVDDVCRGIVLIGDEEAETELATELAGSVLLKPMASDFSAIVYAVPVQLLAYHAAVFMGKDVDQPRNLAKSVTVE